MVLYKDNKTACTVYVGGNVTHKGAITGFRGLQKSRILQRFVPLQSSVEYNKISYISM